MGVMLDGPDTPRCKSYIITEVLSVRRRDEVRATRVEGTGFWTR